MDLLLLSRHHTLSALGFSFSFSFFLLGCLVILTASQLLLCFFWFLLLVSSTRSVSHCWHDIHFAFRANFTRLTNIEHQPSSDDESTMATADGDQVSIPLPCCLLTFFLDGSSHNSGLSVSTSILIPGRSHLISQQVRCRRFLLFVVSKWTNVSVLTFCVAMASVSSETCVYLPNVSHGGKTNRSSMKKESPSWLHKCYIQRDWSLPQATASCLIVELRR